MKRRSIAVAGLAVLVACGVWRYRACDDGTPSGGAVARPTESVVPVVVHGTPRPDPAKLLRGTISGVISDDATRAPIAGARVCARGASNELSEDLLRDATCGVTDARGVYRLEQVLPAEYQLAASAKGYRPAAFHRGGDRHERRVLVASGTHAKDVNIALRAGGVEITGVVSDVTGGPIARARVWGSRDERVLYETDDEGAFSIWVEPGYTDVSATADGYAPGSASTSAPGTVEVLLTPESTLSGTVVDAASGAPVEGARVQIGDEDDEQLQISDAQGEFRFSRLMPGRVVATARTEGGYGRSEGSILVGLGQHTSGVTLRLFPAVRIEGTVVISGTGARCEEPEVRLEEHAANRQLSMMREPDGTLWLDGVLPGTYTVRPTCRGYVAKATYPAIVIAERPALGLRWDVEGGATLRGRVLAADGRPVEAATVYAEADGGHGRDVSARDGSYTLTGLAAGSYSVEVRSQTHAAPKAGSVVVPAGATVTHDLVLEEAGAIEGSIVDEKGQPVGGVDAVASRIDGRGFGMARVGDRGTLLIEGLPAGTYRVEAQRGIDPLRRPGTSDDQEQGVRVAVRARQTATARIVVESQAGTIHGKVVDAKGAPVVDAFVSAARESDAAGTQGSSVADTRWQWDARPVVTGVDGTFVLSRLAPGTYAVRAYRRGGGEAIAEHVQTGTTTRLVIKPTGIIEGIVRRSDNTPITELEVWLVDNATKLWRGDTFFRTDGRFMFRDLPAGSYTLEVTAAGGHGMHVLALAEGARASGVNIVLDTLVHVRGRVVDRASGKPVAGVDMYAQLFPSANRIYGDDETGRDITAADGTFTLSRVPRGKLVLTGIPRGWPESEYPDLHAVRTPTGSGPVVDVGDLPVLRRRVKSGEPAGKLGVHFVEHGTAEPADVPRLEIAWIDPTGPAAKSGLVVGDEITAIDGVDVSAAGNDAYTLLVAPPGTRLMLALKRGASVTVTLAPP